jgi:hypothetical protein
MLFIVCDYAACLLAALIRGTLLFSFGATCVMLWESRGITGWWWRELAAVPDWLMGRPTAEPRVQ